MKNKILLLGLAGIFMISCNSKVETKITDEVVAVNKDSIKTVIQDMEDAYAKAMEQKSIDGIMTYYGDDIMSVDNGSTPVIGKENVKKSIMAQLPHIPANAKITMKAEDVMVSNDGEMVHESGSYAMKDSTGTAISTGYYAAMFQKKDGKYECVREMVSSTKKEEKK